MWWVAPIINCWRLLNCHFPSQSNPFVFYKASCYCKLSAVSDASMVSSTFRLAASTQHRHAHAEKFRWWNLYSVPYKPNIMYTLLLMGLKRIPHLPKLLFTLYHLQQISFDYTSVLIEKWRNIYSFLMTFRSQ